MERHQKFAKALGFDDYESLMRASEPVVHEGYVDLFISQLPDGRWAAWDDAEPSLERVEYFATREEAAEFHQSINTFARILIDWWLADPRVED